MEEPAIGIVFAVQSSDVGGRLLHDRGIPSEEFVGSFARDGNDMTLFSQGCSDFIDRDFVGGREGYTELIDHVFPSFDETVLGDFDFGVGGAEFFG